MRNNEYSRLIISKRVAVKAVVDIANAVLLYGSSELTSWGLHEGIYSPGRSDGGVYSLIDKVKQYKRDAEKYYAIQKLLKEVVK